MSEGLRGKIGSGRSLGWAGHSRVAGYTLRTKRLNVYISPKSRDTVYFAEAALYAWLVAGHGFERNSTRVIMYAVPMSDH